MSTTDFNDTGSKIAVRILSATYGPSHERRLMHGEVVPADATLRMPYSRDVLPIILAYLHRKQNVHEIHCGILLEEDDRLDTACRKLTGANVAEDFYCKRRKLGSEKSLKNANEVAIMDGKSMNIIFGDPCPGTTKRLDLTYVFNDNFQRGSDIESDIFNHSLICHASFAEHEQVLLKRKVFKSAGENNLQSTGKHGRELETLSRNQLATCQRFGDSEGLVSATNKLLNESKVDSALSVQSNGQSIKWKLHSEVSEIVLPIILPYLTLLQRLQCQQVCKTWKMVISEQGVAEYIDINEPFAFVAKTRYTNRILKGIISNSYPSLQRLFLNNYTALSPQDFHPVIPHLRKLTQLDVSRCVELNNETLLLIARHLKDTLEILYMKGLRNTSDIGLIAISESCHKLCILEISNVPITDASGTAIGQHLHKLVALYMRDNFLLTNMSLNAILSGCSKLTQLTLWGCTRITNFQGDSWGAADGNSGAIESCHKDYGISYVSNNPACFNFNITSSGLLAENRVIGARNLAVLNLWGCHGLQDDSFLCFGAAWNPFERLKTLIISECHQLTDNFILNLVKVVPRLIHLHLRYLRRITDCSIHAIASVMTQLYSIDLSFCNRITSSAIQDLVGTLKHGLAEIRLYSCHQIDEWGFNQIINTLQSSHPISLSVLDVRECGIGSFNFDVVEVEGEPNFVQRLKSPPLCFTEPVPCYFFRPAIFIGNKQDQLGFLN